MTQDQALLAVTAALAVVSLLVVTWIGARDRRRSRSAALPLARAWSVEPATPGDPGAAEGARTVAAIEAFVAGVSDEPYGRRPPPPWSVVPRATEATAAPAPASPDPRAAIDDATLRPRPTSRPATEDPAVADAATWSRAIREESARVARFGHPATIVMAEVPRVDAIADRLGPGVVERVVSEAARLLVSDTRAADRVARLGDGRFGILLLETDEAAARGYVERVRRAVDRWLESTGLSVRLSLGWASPTDGGDVLAAAATAEQRMHDEDRGPRPVSGP
jgi:diguanylate cyclase (GGDEF)-like protein